MNRLTGTVDGRMKDIGHSTVNHLPPYSYHRSHGYVLYQAYDNNRDPSKSDALVGQLAVEEQPAFQSPVVIRSPINLNAHTKNI